MCNYIFQKQNEVLLENVRSISGNMKKDRNLQITVEWEYVNIFQKKGMKFPIVLVEDVSFYVRSISGKRWSIVVRLNPNHINHDSWQASNLEKNTHQKKKRDFITI